MKRKTIKKIIRLPRLVLIWVIWLYQKTLSPDHGPLKCFHQYGYCKFYPSCSEYGRRIIKKRGVLIGIPKTLWRILRCNPLNKGGIDLPR